MSALGVYRRLSSLMSFEHISMSYVPTMLTISEQDRTHSSYIFDAELGVLLDYVDVIDDEVEDYFATSRVYIPVELGPQPA